MRRDLAAVAVWLVATAVAVALATAAIGTVVEQDGPRSPGVGLDAVPAPAATATAPAPGPSGTPAARTDVGAEPRTYELVGGSAAVQAVGGRVALRWATPATGFDVDVDEDAEGVDVEFRADDHRSRLRVWLEGSRLQARVDEDPR